MKQNEDEEIIAIDKDITINIKELKTSLPKLVDELYDVSTIPLLKKLMLLIEVRFEIIQDTLKPILNDNIGVLKSGKETIEETNNLLDEIKEQMEKLKENE